MFKCFWTIFLLGAPDCRNVAFQSQHYEFKQRKNRLFVFENQYTGTASALICALKSRM